MKNRTERLISLTRLTLPAHILTHVRVQPTRTILILGLLMISATLANAQVCPPVGNDTDCGTIITISNTGVSVSSTGQGPYDGIEDTLVGVVNNSSLPIHALGLKSAQTVFGFDGDGIDTYGIPGNIFDFTGYGGPNAYFTNIDPSLTSGDVNFITPIAANGGTAYFSLEEAISNAYSCKQVVDGSVTPQAAGANMDAKFKPNLNLNLQQAAQFCGFVDFDWVQKITRQDNPSMFYARNIGGAFDATVNGPVNLSSARTPYSDPPQGGGYTYSAQPDFSYPFYYDKTTELPNFKVGGNMLNFHDAPADGCLPGGAQAGTAACNNMTEPAGSFGGYTTHLAGVNSDGTATDLGIGFNWTSNYNGTTGGVHIKKTNALADGNGTGGVTITGVQNTTNYQYNGVTVTTVNGVPVNTLQASIQIKPPSAEPVSVNPRAQGVTPVAILTTTDFDATLVDAATVRFGPNAARNSSPATLQDINGDGKPDLVLHFRDQDAGIGCGATTATLTGKTLTQQSFGGSEAIRTVGCK
jgi:hypothetical protein